MLEVPETLRDGQFECMAFRRCNIDLGALHTLAGIKTSSCRRLRAVADKLDAVR